MSPGASSINKQGGGMEIVKNLPTNQKQFTKQDPENNKFPQCMMRGMNVVNVIGQD